MGVLAMFAMLLCLLLLPGKEFHVAPGGNDKGPGSATQPFLTLERARDAIRSLKISSGLPAEGVTVWLHGGVYPRTRSFELLAEDSGEKSRPIIYRAVEGEEVRLVGGVPIPGKDFTPVTSEQILGRLPLEARGRVLEIDLSAYGLRSYGALQRIGHGLPVVPAPIELFFDDCPMTLARYPNQGSIPMGKVLDPGSVPRTGDESNRGGTFVYADPHHARWAGLSEAWLQGTFRWGWADDLIRIETIDTVARTVKLASPHVYGLGSGEAFQQYVAINILGELDVPGEYYLDRREGTLYFWPPSDILAGHVMVSTLEEPVVVMENVSSLTLQGVTVEASRGMGLYMEGGEGNTIAGCVFRNLGTVGVMVGQGAEGSGGRQAIDEYDGRPASRVLGSVLNQLYRYTAWDRKCGRNHTIVSCDIYNTGSGGIFLGGGSKKALRAGNNVVRNCVIHDYSRRNKFSWAGVNVDGCGNTVEHNEIHDSNCQAIMVRGNDHLFEFNHIYNIGFDSDDTSPWYLGRDPSDRGNVVRFNFFHHVGRPDRMIMGVYLDDATCGTTITGNIFYKVASYGTVYSNAGHDNVIRNNIFIEGYGPAVFVKSMWYDFGRAEKEYFFGPRGVYRNRLLHEVDIRKPPYSTRYPELADWMDLLPDGVTYVGERPRRNVMEGNVIWRNSEVLRLMADYAQCEEMNNVVVDGDPGFVDARSMNFALRDDSIVYRKLPGFPKIPFGEIGPREDGLRRGEPSTP
jgi:hypothetical protein